MMGQNSFDPRLDQYLRQQQQHAAINPLLASVPQAFLQQGQQLYDRFHTSDGRRKLQLAVKKIVGVFHTDIVQYLPTFDDLHIAKPIMIPYVMACPELRTLYEYGDSEGYGDNYCDLQPGIIGEGHVHYDRVMNGVMTAIKDEDGEETDDYEYYITIPEDEDDVANQIEPYQQVDVLRTWETVIRCIVAGIDPASPTGNKL